MKKYFYFAAIVVVILLFMALPVVVLADGVDDDSFYRKIDPCEYDIHRPAPCEDKRQYYLDTLEYNNHGHWVKPVYHDVPEPSPLMLTGLALVILAVINRKGRAR